MTGLTQEQVQAQIEAGNVNINENPNTRTYKQIILENTLTFFNFINAVSWCWCWWWALTKTLPLWGSS